MSAPPAQNQYLSKKYIDGVYIPSGLLIVGCLIVKREWVPYAVVLALVLGGYKAWSNRMYKPRHICQSRFQNRSSTTSRNPSSSETCCLPGLRTQGEDHHFSQCSHVSTHPNPVNNLLTFIAIVSPSHPRPQFSASQSASTSPSLPPSLNRTAPPKKSSDRTPLSPVTTNRATLTSSSNPIPQATSPSTWHP